MPADPTGVFQPIYTVRVSLDDEIKAALIPGASLLVRLSLGLRDRPDLVAAMVDQGGGATLVLDMGRDEAVRIFSQIQKLAVTMGWPLPA